RSKHVDGALVVDGFSRSAAPRTAAALVDLGRRLTASSPRLPLFYGNDAQLALLHAYRVPLSEWFGFVLNDDALAPDLQNKEAFCARAERLGIPVPRTVRGSDPEAIARLRAPLLVKPRAKIEWKHLKRALFDGHAKAKTFATHRALMDDLAFR